MRMPKKKPFRNLRRRNNNAAGETDCGDAIPNKLCLSRSRRTKPASPAFQIHFTVDNQVDMSDGAMFWKVLSDRGFTSGLWIALSNVHSLMAQSSNNNNNSSNNNNNTIAIINISTTKNVSTTNDIKFYDGPMKFHFSNSAVNMDNTTNMRM
ncbi:hypothetical protein HELRODRAFT_164287 [Helobdella robusta]|uniref:Uncharacterized protein n=1 Tax=Helobdella robusta TaxID=6412 RepID=T1EV77_HELRO|nr:hypothetical protein HELRODRAFT_164287 [Helobdella robusta]ESN94444.1 hypothetical protein HELRODRAFT_164287 [Helobdella robusta]